MTRTLSFFILTLLGLILTNSLFGQIDSSSSTVSTFTVPEIMAEYPGGVKQLQKYILTNVLDKLTTSQITNNIGTIAVKFFIDENGKTSSPELIKKSSDPAINKLVIDAINKMPLWKPAENPAGRKVKQAFSFPIYIRVK